MSETQTSAWHHSDVVSIRVQRQKFAWFRLIALPSWGRLAFTCLCPWLSRQTADKAFRLSPHLVQNYSCRVFYAISFVGSVACSWDWCTWAGISVWEAGQIWSRCPVVCIGSTGLRTWGVCRKFCCCVEASCGTCWCLWLYFQFLLFWVFTRLCPTFPLQIVSHLDCGVFLGLCSWAQPDHSIPALVDWRHCLSVHVMPYSAAQSSVVDFDSAIPEWREIAVNFRLHVTDS